MKPLTGEGRETARIKVQLFLEPVISSNEGALSWLSRATDQFVGEKFCEGCIELGRRIRLPIRRQEKTGIVLLALISAEEPLSIVQQEMPFTLVREVFLLRLDDQILKIGLMIKLLSMRDDWKEEANYKNEEWHQHGVTKDRKGPDISARAPIMPQRTDACARTGWPAMASLRDLTNATGEASPA